MTNFGFMELQSQNGVSPQVTEPAIPSPESPLSGVSEVIASPPGIVPGGEATLTPESTPAITLGDPPAETPRTELVTLLREGGFELGDDYDDKTFMEDLEILQSQATTPAAPQATPELDEYLGNREAYVAWKQEQSQQQAPPIPEEPAVDPRFETHPDIVALLNTEKPDAFAVSMAQQGEIKQNPKGVWITERDELKTYAAQLNNAERAKQKFPNAFVDNPVEIFDKMLQPKLAKFQEEIEKRDQIISDMQAQSTQRDAQSLIMEDLAKHDDRFFNSDGTQTFEADQYTEYVNRLATKHGVEDPIDRHNQAMRFLDDVKSFNLGAAPTAPAAGPEPEAIQEPPKKERKRVTFARRRSEEGTQRVAAQPGTDDRLPNRQVSPTGHVPQPVNGKNRFLQMCQDTMASNQ